jgi:ribosomal protein L23
MRIEISVEFLASLLGKEVGTLKESFEKEGANHEELIKSDIVAKLAQAKRDGKDESYGRAKREVAETYEKDLAEKLGTKVGKLDEMVAEYQQKIKSSIDKDDDPVKIRNSQVYIEDLKAEKLKIQELENDYKNKLSSFEREKVETVIREKAIDLISKKNYVLPTNEDAKKNQINLLIKELMNENQFKVLDGKKVQILDKENNVVRNELLDEMDFDSYFTGKANSYFDISDQDGRRAPENRQQDPNNPKPKVTVSPFKDENEYANALYSTTDPDTLEAMGQMFDSQVKRGDFAATT